MQELESKKNIQEITFILSNKNVILTNDKSYDISQIDRLTNLNNQIVKQQKYSETLWLNGGNISLKLSYHIRNKIKELKFGLNSLFLGDLKINGKIYNREKMVFNDIYTELICLESFNLN